MSVVMTDDDVLTDILTNWRAWCLRPDLGIGWPKRSHPFQGASDAQYGGQIPQSDYYADVDEREAKVVDTVIHDMPSIYRAAISNVVLNTRQPIPGGEPLQVVYLRARAMLKVRLAAKGIG